MEEVGRSGWLGGVEGVRMAREPRPMVVCIELAMGEISIIQWAPGTWATGVGL